MFKLGQTVMTAGVADEVCVSVVMACLRRHSRGEWGSLGREDTKMNDDAIKYRKIKGELPYRLFSAYEMDNFKLWIVTEYDESVTTIMFPSEY